MAIKQALPKAWIKTEEVITKSSSKLVHKRYIIHKGLKNVAHIDLHNKKEKENSSYAKIRP